MDKKTKTEEGLDCKQAAVILLKNRELGSSDPVDKAHFQANI